MDAAAGAARLELAFLGIAATSFGLAVLLFAIKVVHRSRERAAGVRRAHYIGAIGEIVARHAVPQGELVGWADDPMFLEVLFDFLTIVTGDERATLETLVDKLELEKKLGERLDTARRKRDKLRAAIYLVEIAQPDLQDRFLAMLSSPIDELRLHGVRGLARVADPETVPMVLARMESEKPWMAARFADALALYGSRATPHLIRYLILSGLDGGRTDDTLRLVVRVLGLIGDLAAEPFLLDLLDADKPILRVRAASALGSAGSPASVPALIRALRDDEASVRARAAVALGGLSDGRAVEPLGAALRDPSWWVRQNSAGALADLPGGMERLVAALEDKDPYARDAAAQRLGLAGVLPGPVAERVSDGPVPVEKQVAG